MKNISRISFSIVAMKISSFFKISFIVGSTKAFFAGTSVLAPASGLVLSRFNHSVVWAIRLLMHLLCYQSLSLHFLAFFVPGYCASFYLLTKNRLFSLCVPLICMFLFVTHPVGAQAYVYSFYWFIPMILSCMPRKNLFQEALCSTFIAHAVGSVIWIYTTISCAAMWVGLLPIVAIERLLFALGIVGVYKIIMSCTNGKASSMYYGWKSALCTTAQVGIGKRV